MNKKFRVCTLVNDLQLYQGLMRSLESSGFNDTVCEFQLFDNTKKNLVDAYGMIKQVLSDAKEDYVIFVHQDIVLDRGDGFPKLASILDLMNSRFPRWAVLGNAGHNRNFQFVTNIRDPHCYPAWNGEFPQEVLNLDENFLVVRNGLNVFPTEGLSGFHFYGADLCLNARRIGLKCYVVDFRLTHLSPGRRDVIFWQKLDETRDLYSQKYFHLHAILNGRIVYCSKLVFARTVFQCGFVLRLLSRIRVLNYLRTLIV